MKKQKVNEGEVPQYYVEGSHEAIIDPEEFEKVQTELARRKRIGRSYSGDSAFASRLFCADCGGCYGPKVWHSNDSYRRVIWQCNHKFKHEQKCQTPTIDEKGIKTLFLKAYNILMGDRETVLENCRMIYQTLGDCSDLDSKIDELTEEIKIVSEMAAAQVRQHATQAEPEEAYNKRRAALVERYEKAKASRDQLQAERQQRLDQRKKVKRFCETLKEQPLVLPEWDEHLWSRIVEKVTFYPDGRATFCFVKGTEVTVNAEK